MTNKEFAKNDSGFNKACDDVDVKVTSRQASKWRSGKGKAYRVKVLKHNLERLHEINLK